MTLLDSLRQRLFGIRAKAQTATASAYWRAADAVAQGQEPKVRDEDLLESMQALGKTEDDLEEDAQLLGSLRAQESILATRTAVEKRDAKLLQEAQALSAEAVQLRQEAERKAAEAEHLQKRRSHERTAIENAEREATRLRTVLGQRGHQQLRERVAAEDAARERASRIEGLETQLPRAVADLASAERDLADAINANTRTDLPKRLIDGELVPDERHLPDVEIWQGKRDRAAERVERIRTELEQLRGGPVPAEPASA